RAVVEIELLAGAEATPGTDHLVPTTDHLEQAPRREAVRSGPASPHQRGASGEDLESPERAAWDEDLLRVMFHRLEVAEQEAHLGVALEHRGTAREPLDRHGAIVVGE